MRRYLTQLGLCLLLLSIAVFPGRAARDPAVGSVAQSDYELLVLEVAKCIYCRLFRRDVVPTYEASARSKSVPMRFIDLDHGSLDAFELKAPVKMLPTVILTHHRREVGRLAGHVGPEVFLHAIDRLLSEAP